MALLRRREDRPARRGTPADLLVVGLGNPGREYERSRHNVGAEVVKRLAAAHGGSLKAGKERALVTEVRIADQSMALAFPTTFMNLSGESVVKLVRRYGIEDPAQIVIVQDELDLPPGTVRVKLGGGLAGHNGLRSIAHADPYTPEDPGLHPCTDRRGQAPLERARRQPRAEPHPEGRARTAR